MEFEIKCEPDLDILDDEPPNETNYYEVESQYVDSISTTFTIDGTVYDIREIQELSSTKIKEETGAVTPELNWNCNICNKSFETKSSLRSHKGQHAKHLRASNNLNPVSTDDVVCEECSNVIPLKNYSGHLYACHKKTVKLIKCQHCKRFRRGKILLERHLNSTHKLLRQCLTCNICETVFSSTNDLNNHVRKMHLPNEDDDDLDTLKCVLCPVKVHTKRDFEYHRLSHFEKPFRCDVCWKMNKTEEELEQHKQHHIEQKSVEQLSGQDSPKLSPIVWRPVVIVSPPKEPLKRSSAKKIIDVSTEKPVSQPKKQKISSTKAGKVHLHDMVRVVQKKFSEGSSTARKPLQRRVQAKPSVIKEMFSCHFCAKEFVLRRDVQRHTQEVHLDNLNKS